MDECFDDVVWGFLLCWSSCDQPPLVSGFFNFACVWEKIPKAMFDSIVKKTTANAAIRKYPAKSHSNWQLLKENHVDICMLYYHHVFSVSSTLMHSTSVCSSMLHQIGHLSTALNRDPMPNAHLKNDPPEPRTARSTFSFFYFLTPRDPWAVNGEDHEEKFRPRHQIQPDCFVRFPKLR